MNSHTFKDVQSKYRYSFGLELVFIFYLSVQNLPKSKARPKVKVNWKKWLAAAMFLENSFSSKGNFKMPLLNTRFGIDLSTLIQVTDVFFQEERAICQELNDTMGIGIAHRKIGEALNELGNYESATKHHQKYLGNNNAVLKSYLAVKMNLILQSSWIAL